MNKEYFGWHLLLGTVAWDVKSDFDILVCVIHWHMIRKGFACLGLDYDETFVTKKMGTELLPVHWNAQEYAYKFRYQKDGNNFILTAMKTQGFALFNLLNVKNKELTHVLFEVKEIVRGRTGNLPDVINNPPEVLKKINDELLSHKTKKQDMNDGPIAFTSPPASPSHAPSSSSYNPANSSYTPASPYNTLESPQHSSESSSYSPGSPSYSPLNVKREDLNHSEQSDGETHSHEPSESYHSDDPEIKKEIKKEEIDVIDLTL